MTLFNLNCLRNFTRYDLDKTQKYLQSVSWEQSPPDNYGYAESNPIVLKLSADLKYDQIIDAYIDRLWKNGNGISNGKPQSFSVIEKRKIPFHYFISDKTITPIIKDYSKWIFAYKIISTDKSETLTLYFKLDSKNKKPYRVNGFLYSMIVG